MEIIGGKFLLYEWQFTNTHVSNKSLLLLGMVPFPCRVLGIEFYVVFQNQQKVSVLVIYNSSVSDANGTLIARRITNSTDHFPSFCGLFYNTVSIQNIESNSRDIINWIDLEGSIRGLIKHYHNICLELLVETTKISVRTAGVSVETRTKHFSNTSILLEKLILFQLIKIFTAF
jgi:hypothetical protein